MAEDWGALLDILPMLERLVRSTPYSKAGGQGLTDEELSQVSFPERLLHDMASSGPGMNLAMQWSDRPRNAIASLVSSLQGGSGVEDAASDAWKGVRGDKETSWGDVFGVPEENWGQRWALDALIDPQNAIPFGTLAKLLEGGALKGGGSMMRSLMKPLMNESGAIEAFGRRGRPLAGAEDRLGQVTEEIRNALSNLGNESSLKELRSGPNEVWQFLNEIASPTEKAAAKKTAAATDGFWDRIPDGQFSSAPFTLDDYFKNMGVNAVHLGEDIGMQDLYSALERAAMNDPKVSVPMGMNPARDMRYKPPARPLDQSPQLMQIMDELENMPMNSPSLEQITNRSRNLPTNTVTMDQLAGDLGRTRPDDMVWWDKMWMKDDLLKRLKSGADWWMSTSDSATAQAARALDALARNHPVLTTAGLSGMGLSPLYALLGDSFEDSRPQRASLYDQNRFQQATGRSMY